MFLAKLTSSLPTLQHKRRSLQEGIEILDLLQDAATVTLIANFTCDALQKKLSSNLLARAESRIIWVSLLSAFDG